MRLRAAPFSFLCMAGREEGTPTNGRASPGARSRNSFGSLLAEGVRSFTSSPRPEAGEGPYSGPVRRGIREELDAIKGELAVQVQDAEHSARAMEGRLMQRLDDCMREQAAFRRAVEMQIVESVKAALNPHLQTLGSAALAQGDTPGHGRPNGAPSHYDWEQTTQGGSPAAGSRVDAAEENGAPALGAGGSDADLGPNRPVRAPETPLSAGEDITFDTRDRVLMDTVTACLAELRAPKGDLTVRGELERQLQECAAVGVSLGEVMENLPQRESVRDAVRTLTSGLSSPLTTAEGRMREFDQEDWGRADDTGTGTSLGADRDTDSWTHESHPGRESPSARSLSEREFVDEVGAGGVDATALMAKVKSAPPKLGAPESPQGLLDVGLAWGELDVGREVLGSAADAVKCDWPVYDRTAGQLFISPKTNLIYLPPPSEVGLLDRRSDGYCQKLLESPVIYVVEAEGRLLLRTAIQRHDTLLEAFEGVAPYVRAVSYVVRLQRMPPPRVEPGPEPRGRDAVAEVPARRIAAEARGGSLGGTSSRASSLQEPADWTRGTSLASRAALGTGSAQSWVTGLDTGNREELRSRGVAVAPPWERAVGAYESPPSTRAAAPSRSADEAAAREAVMREEREVLPVQRLARAVEGVARAHRSPFDAGALQKRKGTAETPMPSDHDGLKLTLLQGLGQHTGIVLSPDGGAGDAQTLISNFRKHGLMEQLRMRFRFHPAIALALIHHEPCRAPADFYVVQSSVTERIRERVKIKSSLKMPAKKDDPSPSVHLADWRARALEATNVYVRRYGLFHKRQRENMVIFLSYLCDQHPSRFPLVLVKEAYERARDQYEEEVDRLLSWALTVMEAGDDCPAKPSRQALASTIAALGAQGQLDGYGPVGLPKTWAFTLASDRMHFEENTAPEEFAKYDLRPGSVLKQLMDERSAMLDERLQIRVNEDLAQSYRKDRDPARRAGAVPSPAAGSDEGAEEDKAKGKPKYPAGPMIPKEDYDQGLQAIRKLAPGVCHEHNTHGGCSKGNCRLDHKSIPVEEFERWPPVAQAIMAKRGGHRGNQRLEPHEVAGAVRVLLGMGGTRAGREPLNDLDAVACAPRHGQENELARLVALDPVWLSQEAPEAKGVAAWKGSDSPFAARQRALSELPCLKEFRASTVPEAFQAFFFSALANQVGVESTRDQIHAATQEVLARGSESGLHGISRPAWEFLQKLGGHSVRAGSGHVLGERALFVGPTVKIGTLGQGSQVSLCHREFFAIETGEVLDLGGGKSVKNQCVLLALAHHSAKTPALVHRACARAARRAQKIMSRKSHITYEQAAIVESAHDILSSDHTHDLMHVMHYGEEIGLCGTLLVVQHVPGSGEAILDAIDFSEPHPDSPVAAVIVSRDHCRPLLPADGVITQQYLDGLPALHRRWAVPWREVLDKGGSGSIRCSELVACSQCGELGVHLVAPGAVRAGRVHTAVLSGEMPGLLRRWCEAREDDPKLLWARPSPARACGLVECGMCPGGCSLGPDGATCAAELVDLSSGPGVDPSVDDIHRHGASDEAFETCTEIQDTYEGALTNVEAIVAQKKRNEDVPADMIAAFREAFARVIALGDKLTVLAGGTWEDTVKLYLRSWWARYGRNVDASRIQALVDNGFLDGVLGRYLIEVANHGVSMRSDLPPLTGAPLVPPHQPAVEHLLDVSLQLFKEGAAGYMLFGSSASQPQWDVVASPFSCTEKKELDGTVKIGQVRLIHDISHDPQLLKQGLRAWREATGRRDSPPRCGAGSPAVQEPQAGRLGYEVSKKCSGPSYTGFCQAPGPPSQRRDAGWRARPRCWEERNPTHCRQKSESTGGGERQGPS